MHRRAALKSAKLRRQVTNRRLLLACQGMATGNQLWKHPQGYTALGIGEPSLGVSNRRPSCLGKSFVPLPNAS